MKSRFQHGVVVERLRYPGERRLYKHTLWVVAIGYLLASGLTLALWAGWIALACVTVMVLRNRYPSMAVEVGPAQLPRVHSLVQELSEALDVVPPRVFLSEEPGRRPVFTVPLPEPAIMMNAAWVKMLSDEELAFFLVKELAHGKLGHRWVLNPIHVLENVGPVSWVLTTPLELMRYALRPWLRRAEFSADRVALAVLHGDLDLAAGALAKVTAGEELFDEVDGQAFLEQCRRLEGGWGLTVLEVATGKLGFGSRLGKLARFSDQDDFAHLTRGEKPPPPLSWWGRVKRRLGVRVDVEFQDDPTPALPATPHSA